MKTRTADKTTVALFPNYAHAAQAILELKENSFENSDLSIVIQDSEQAKQLATDTGTRVSQGAAAGAGTGAVIGGVTGLVLGLAALAIPGIGPVLAAGPIATALGATGVGAATGATAGGLLGALTGRGASEAEALHYQEGVKLGDAFIAAATNEHNETYVENVFKKHGGRDIKTLSANKVEEARQRTREEASA